MPNVPVKAARADARRSRERILAAAEPLLAREPRATMAQVADAAGVGRSTLHRHFATRVDLVRALEPGASDASEPEAVDVLDDVAPHLVAEQLVAEARRTAGVPVALYVIDIDGSALLRLAGDAPGLADRIEAPLGLGPEIAPDSLPDLYATLDAALPGCRPVPLWLRGRATGVLLAVGQPRRPLTALARQGAAALELANGQTDAFEAVRRSRATSPAAEMQLNLLPPARIMRVAGGEVAGGMLPSEAVGGDWFDLAENADGTWLALADAAGEGAVAAGRAAVSLGALRSARRQGLGLTASAAAIDRTVRELGGAAPPNAEAGAPPRPDFTVSAVLAHWQAPTATFSWIACGHAPPLLITERGDVVALEEGDGEAALGDDAAGRAFRPLSRRLQAGERVVLCSDGLLERRTADGVRFGEAGVRAAVASASGRSAAATARSIQHAAAGAAAVPPDDDLVVVVLAAL